MKSSSMSFVSSMSAPGKTGSRYGCCCCCCTSITDPRVTGSVENRKEEEKEAEGKVDGGREKTDDDEAEAGRLGESRSDEEDVS